ncbi:hypothetical protein F8388_004208 [Cannabis sativa]|uniref:F-box associated beta-propeller type 1 domain-containing protein n=1 Tax=Cannabis sativa TaxID=3483 RepID=A0A7J6E769_CANSA|nr:hypothetical protein F8388_004208 [Cannabis sativa]
MIGYPILLDWIGLDRSVGIGSDDFLHTPTYKAIEIVYYMEGNNLYLGTIKETKVYVFNLGEDCQWRCIDQKPHKIITCPSSDVLVNGNLHWLTMRYQTHLVDIVSFDLDKEEFHVIPQPVDFCLNKSLTHLVTLNDRLSAVVSSKFGEHEIWVLKDYNKKESWSKEIVIPDYVPMGFRMDSAPPTRIRFNGSRNKAFRVLCNLQGSLISVDAAFANNSTTPSSTLNYFAQSNSLSSYMSWQHE